MVYHICESVSLQANAVVTVLNKGIKMEALHRVLWKGPRHQHSPSSPVRKFLSGCDLKRKQTNKTNLKKTKLFFVQSFSGNGTGWQGRYLHKIVRSEFWNSTHIRLWFYSSRRKKDLTAKNPQTTGKSLVSKDSKVSFHTSRIILLARGATRCKRKIYVRYLDSNTGRWHIPHKPFEHACRQATVIHFPEYQFCPYLCPLIASYKTQRIPDDEETSITCGSVGILQIQTAKKYDLEAFF